MALKLTRVELPQLLPWLEHHLPDSFKVHGELKSHLRGQFPDLEFFVDRWPCPQAVVATVDLAGKQLLCKEYLKNVVQGIYGTNDDALHRLLKDPSVVDWSIKTVFSGVSDRLMTVLSSAAKEMGKQNFRFNPNFLLKATPQDLTPIPVPDGLNFRPVSTTEIKVINSTWKFSNEDSEAYIQSSVERFPSLSLVTENGQHIGHMMGSSYGTMGMLYVNPDFRGKGYAKVIVTQLAQKYFDKGDDVYVFIEEDNLRSLRLHESLKFKVIPEIKVFWVSTF